MSKCVRTESNSNTAEFRHCIVPNAVSQSLCARIARPKRLLLLSQASLTQVSLAVIRSIENATKCCRWPVRGLIAAFRGIPPFVPRLQAPPPPIGQPFVSNVAAYAVDVSWKPPVDYWHALAVTGYQVWCCSSVSPLRSGDKRIPGAAHVGSRTSFHHSRCPSCFLRPTSCPLPFPFVADLALRTPTSYRPCPPSRTSTRSRKDWMAIF